MKNKWLEKGNLRYTAWAPDAFAGPFISLGKTSGKASALPFYDGQQALYPFPSLLQGQQNPALPQCFALVIVILDSLDCNVRIPLVELP